MSGIILGIESTAHTFSFGSVSTEGDLFLHFLHYSDQMREESIHERLLITPNQPQSYSTSSQEKGIFLGTQLLQ